MCKLRERSFRSRGGYANWNWRERFPVRVNFTECKSVRIVISLQSENGWLLLLWNTFTAMKSCEMMKIKLILSFVESMFSFIMATIVYVCDVSIKCALAAHHNKRRPAGIQGYFVYRSYNKYSYSWTLVVMHKRFFKFLAFRNMPPCECVAWDKTLKWRNCCFFHYRPQTWI